MTDAPHSASFADDPVNNLGSNLLKVTIGLAALVFIIMLQASWRVFKPFFYPLV